MIFFFQKQSEILEKLSCPNTGKLLKTLFKPVKPILVDIKLKTTTSSSESGKVPFLLLDCVK